MSETGLCVKACQAGSGRRHCPTTLSLTFQVEEEFSLDPEIYNIDGQ